MGVKEQKKNHTPQHTHAHTQSQTGGGKKIDCTDHLKHKNALNS